MKKYHWYWLLACLLCSSMLSCQKVMIDDPTEENGDGSRVVVRLNVDRLEMLPFAGAKSTRATDVKAVCSRLNLAVYQNGERIEQVNQESSSDTYGQLKVVLAPGQYTVAVIAHSGAKNAVMTNPEKITFDGKVTDTFYYYGELTVRGDTSQDLTLQRAVAMFRLKITDKVPENVSRMHFFYTGGSSTFDAVHGVGCVKSQQGELRDVVADMYEHGGVFEVYTFPRADSNVLSVTVKALDAGNNLLVEKQFPEVAVKRNMITQYQGSFFGGPPSGDNAKEDSICINWDSPDEWEQLDKSF